MRSFGIHSFAFFVLFFCVVRTDLAKADIVDFERRPNGDLPTDDTRLNSAYQLTSGGSIGFFFDVDQNGTFNQGDALPFFEQIGNNGVNGFRSSQVGENVFDRARPSNAGGLGNFFLRQPDGIGAFPGPFMIVYNTPQTVREFSGEIWDIDGVQGVYTEQWRVDALDGDGNILAQLLSPLGTNNGANSLDSLPWRFQFRDLPTGFNAIRLSFVGSKTDGIGLAFDNFSPFVAVPEPGCTLVLSGAVALLLLRRKVR